MTPAP
jgi:hypothetical protein